jgi:lipopolysaccharide transport system ATP-binding protein
MKPILEIKNIGKKFRIQHELKPYLSLRESLMGVFKPKTTSVEEFYALKDISFEVHAGDSLGIIGKNGAGKSTLLKILSKITPPSIGKIISRGRIASLLEVGTGFHPELTGRENVFLNGSILGMGRNEIRAKFDEIVDFSGTERFLDTPLKHYSSGMQLRLAFAVAAFLEPEILIIDEVLAVGDAEFQKKCMGKMEDASKKEGKTILFVSHDLNAISTLTKKAILLKAGKIVGFNDTPKIVEQYLEGGSGDRIFTKEIDPTKNIPQVVSVHVVSSLPEATHAADAEMEVKIAINIPEETRTTSWLTVQILDSMEKGLVHVSLNSRELPLCKEKGIQIVTCRFPRLRLYQGQYHFNVYLSGPPGEQIYDVIRNVCPFKVLIIGKERDWHYTQNECAYFEDAKWEIAKN